MNPLVIISATVLVTLAYISALIYTYAYVKMKPRTFPIFAVTTYLWVMAVNLNFMLWKITLTEKESGVAWILMLTAGYVLLLLGAFYRKE